MIGARLGVLRLLIAATVSAAAIVPARLTAQAPMTVTLSSATSLCEKGINVRLSLAAPAPAGGTVVSLTSSIPRTLPLPATATIPAGATETTVSAQCVPTPQPLAVTISATTGSAAGSAVLNVLAPVLQSVSVKDEPITAERTASTYSGSVQLAGPAPAGGVVVTMSANPAVVTVPATLALPAGGTTAAFMVANLPAVSTPTPVTLTATALGVSRSTTFTIAPPIPLRLTMHDANGGIIAQAVDGGDQFDVRLVTSIPSTGGQVYTLTSSHPAVVTVPATVTVNLGSLRDEAVFHVVTRPTSQSTPVTITATAGGVSKMVTVTVRAATIAGVGLPSQLVGGANGQGSVSLNGPAPSAGLVVALSSSSPKLVTPASVTVPGGATFVQFPITSGDVDANTSVRITAVANGITATATTTIAAEGISEFTVVSSTVRGGTSQSGRLTAPTGHNGFTVSLTADSSALVSMPASLTFAPNETSKSFAIVTTPVAARTFVVLKAAVTASNTLSSAVLSARTVALSPSAMTSVSSGGMSTGGGSVSIVRSRGFEIAPPSVTSMALSQNTVIGGPTLRITGTLRFGSPVPAGYGVTFTVEGDGGLIVDDVAPVAANATTVTFTLRAGAVATQRRAILVATARDGSRTAETVVINPRP